MAVANRDPDEELIEEVNRMAGAEHVVARDLEDLHGIKSVVQSKRHYSLIITAHDDYPVLSHLQTVCAWHQCGFDIESAGRADGDIVVRATVDD